ncbi:hypothetical protein T484DRAFT_2910247 [Baffinella frigidus]|nr:hypothetical protein T484DRAFT_2910247 [Cryptophyta sp. CCMP2293]
MGRRPSLKKAAEAAMGGSDKVTGGPRSVESASPWDPTVGLCLGPYGGPRGGVVSHERGTPVTQRWPFLRTHSDRLTDTCS